ncbi:MAG: nicotinamidase [Candidatus Levybacteria bacterium]|nr:nicotinamidase [Candidatus Levybacteria bacterium]
MSGYVRPLTLPPHYDPKNCYLADYSHPDTRVLMDAALVWRGQNGLTPVGNDEVIINVTAIDNQRDFVFPPPYGTLFVGGRSGTGAMDDQARAMAFMYKYMGIITEINNTLDTHVVFQVFFGCAHLNKDGKNPAPYTQISADEYRRGDYRPNPEMAAQLGVDPVWLQKQFIYYCEQLESTGRYKLTIWPDHCLLGTPGHQLTGVMNEMRMFHAWARGANNRLEVKGGNPLTEHYSVFKPEVMTTWDGQAIPGAQKNVEFLRRLMGLSGQHARKNKRVINILWGQALSHCVAWAIDDFLVEINAQDPSLLKTVYILEDCSSPVCVPNPDVPGAFYVDFTPEGQAALDRFRNAGMNVVKSTDPIESWPNIQL